MKNKKLYLLVLPLLLSLGGCSTSEGGGMSVDISGLINSSMDYEDVVKDFLYQSSVANAKLNAMAAEKGYSFKIRVEHEVAPDKDNVSKYYDVVFSGKDELNWATVEQVDKKGNLVESYMAVYENDTDKTYVYYEETWSEIDMSRYNLPYTISDVKGFLVLGAQYMPYIAQKETKKTRTVELGRDCIKYSYKKGENDDFSFLVDYNTQLLMHLTNIEYQDKGVQKDVIKIVEFSEVAPSKPTNYK